MMHMYMYIYMRQGGIRTREYLWELLNSEIDLRSLLEDGHQTILDRLS